VRRYNDGFLEWLRQQDGRDDPVGDLANDFVAGLRANSIRELREQLDVDFRRALLEALIEWRHRADPLPTAEDLTAATRAVQEAQFSAARPPAELCDDKLAELLSPRLRRAREHMERLRRKRRLHFAAERGWRFRVLSTMTRTNVESDLNIRCDDLDGVIEVFTDAEGNTEAVLTHVSDPAPVLRFAGRNGFDVEVLESWHCPGCCSAVLLK